MYVGSYQQFKIISLFVSSDNVTLQIILDRSKMPKYLYYFKTPIWNTMKLQRRYGIRIILYIDFLLPY